MEPEPQEEEEPMQLGRARVRAVEWRKRRQQGENLTCGKGGHFAVSWPSQLRPSVTVGLLPSVTDSVFSHLHCSAKLIFKSLSHSCKAQTQGQSKVSWMPLSPIS